VPPNWFRVARSRQHMTFTLRESMVPESSVRQFFPTARIEVRPATLREIFVALADAGDAPARTPEPAR